jgi:selenocysteine lyase/cysteine desulfurase
MDVTRRTLLKRGLAVGAGAAAFLREDALERVQAAQRKAAGRGPQQLAADEDFWFDIQQAYTVDRSIINLNNGGVSPSPRFVQEAMRRHLEFSNDAPSRHLWQILDPQVETVRARLARTFGCDVEEAAITRNASESLEICIYGIDLRAGDEVLATRLDYPRMINTYKQRELREGVKLVQFSVPAPLEDPAEVARLYERNLTSRTKVILCSHVVFVTGQINPVREICRLGRERGIPVIVDGAHAFAHLPFTRDDLECDYYGTSLHKWLTAPHGTGFLYVRRDKIEGLWPLMAAVEPRSADIRKFEEIGTHPAANRLAIAEALVLHNGIGPERKAARLRYLRDRWAQRLGQDSRVRFLAKPDAVHTCGFTTMSIEGVAPAELVSHLWSKHRVVVIAIDFDNVQGVRVSPNVYTTPREIDLFADAVEDVLANGLPT